MWIIIKGVVWAVLMLVVLYEPARAVERKPLTVGEYVIAVRAVAAGEPYDQDVVKRGLRMVKRTIRVWDATCPNATISLNAEAGRALGDAIKRAAPDRQFGVVLLEHINRSTGGCR